MNLSYKEHVLLRFVEVVDEANAVFVGVAHVFALVHIVVCRRFVHLSATIAEWCA